MSLRDGGVGFRLGDLSSLINIVLQGLLTCVFMDCELAQRLLVGHLVEQRVLIYASRPIHLSGGYLFIDFKYLLDFRLVELIFVSIKLMLLRKRL